MLKRKFIRLTECRNPSKTNTTNLYFKQRRAEAKQCSDDSSAPSSKRQHNKDMMIESQAEFKTLPPFLKQEVASKLYDYVQVQKQQLREDVTEVTNRISIVETRASQAQNHRGIPNHLTCGRLSDAELDEAARHFESTASKNIKVQPGLGGFGHAPRVHLPQQRAVIEEHAEVIDGDDDVPIPWWCTLICTEKSSLSHVPPTPSRNTCIS